MIRIVAHDEKWQKAFTQLKQKLANLCPEILAIRHIGSTAIDDLHAKDIIDIQVAVNTFDDVDFFIPIFKSIGLNFVDSIKQDHVPFHDSEYFDPAWEKRFFTGTYKGQDFNVHVRLPTNPNWAFALDFVDLLSANNEVRFAYQQFKQKLADSGMNREDYCLIKDSYIDLISLLMK